MEGECTGWRSLRFRLNRRRKRWLALWQRLFVSRGGAELQSVGAAAVNQAIKAIAIARGYVAPNGIDLVCVPAFTEVIIEGENRTAIKFIVQPRQGK